MTVEFRPTIKSINIATEDLTKITLEVKNGSLDGKYDDLRKLSGKTVFLTIVPETYSYVIPYDVESEKPQQRYVVNQDGTIDFINEVQTSLDLGDNVPEVENRTFTVTKDLIDEFIMSATSLTFTTTINPRDVLERLEDGEDLADIAADYEMSEVAVLNDLEKAREFYAPYADAWDKKRDEIIFSATAKNDEKEDEAEAEETEDDPY